MKKKALLNLIFDPKQASKMDEFYMFLEANGYEIHLYPTYSTIPSEEILIQELQGMDAFIGSGAPFTARVMDACPQCKIISRTGVGYDSIDVNAATERGIAVMITPGVGAEAVSEYTFTMMAAAARRMAELDRAIRRGEWNRMVGPAIWHKTLGIVGMGRIGKLLAKIAHGFDMTVVAYDTYHDEVFAKENNITYYDCLDEMLKVCDFISVHTNLTSETRGMISNEQFDLMKKSAVLVNAARGGIVDEDALYRALSEKKIAAAALDVFVQEPLPADHPFRTLDNLILSAHNAGSSSEGKNALVEAAFRNVISLEHGNNPAGLLNPQYKDYRS